MSFGVVMSTELVSAERAGVARQDVAFWGLMTAASLLLGVAIGAGLVAMLIPAAVAYAAAFVGRKRPARDYRLTAGRWFARALAMLVWWLAAVGVGVYAAEGDVTATIASAAIAAGFLALLHRIAPRHR